MTFQPFKTKVKQNIGIFRVVSLSHETKSNNKCLTVKSKQKETMRLVHNSA